jgi:V8-like Glu-specific endopeptidase
MRGCVVFGLVCLVFTASACTSGSSPRRAATTPRRSGTPADSTPGTGTPSASTPGTGTPGASTPTASTPADRGAFPTVGALFRNGGSGPHTCTASVVASTTGDTIVTAAHCVQGTPTGVTFVPGYDKGRAPYGSWQVTAAYVSPGWQLDRSPDADYAVLTVAPHVVDGRRVQIADATGSELLGTAPAPGTKVTVVAYNRGTGDDPVVCRAPVFLHRHHYPTFDCHGFIGGSSGSPWLTMDPATGKWVLRGVIGGPYQGGCSEYRSHSSAFTADVATLLDRAEAHGPSDSIARGGDSGC